jgi:hypothetical protein
LNVGALGLFLYEARWRYLQGILPQELQKAHADYHAEKGFG